jgi:hypothetical protein
VSGFFLHIESFPEQLGKIMVHSFISISPCILLQWQYYLYNTCMYIYMYIFMHRFAMILLWLLVHVGFCPCFHYLFELPNKYNSSQRGKNCLYLCVLFVCVCVYGCVCMHICDIHVHLYVWSAIVVFSNIYYQAKPNITKEKQEQIRYFLLQLTNIHSKLTTRYFS